MLRMRFHYMAVLREIALVLAISCALVGLFGSIACAADDANAAAPDGKALIEALVNHNPKPEMVKVHDGPVSGSLSPLYSPTYDWDENRRVSVAFLKLVMSDSDELWPQLVASVDDKRYAKVFDIEGIAFYKTVGDLCFWIAVDDLRHAYIDVAPQRTGFGGILPQFRLFQSPDELVEWWRPRRDKPLYELQIEAAELALAQLPKLDIKQLSMETADRFTTDVNERIAELRRTKRAQFFHRSPLLDRTKSFNAEKAEAIRKLYKAQKDEEK